MGTREREMRSISKGPILTSEGSASQLLRFTELHEGDLYSWDHSVYMGEVWGPHGGEQHYHLEGLAAFLHCPNLLVALNSSSQDEALRRAEYKAEAAERSANAVLSTLQSVMAHLHRLETERHEAEQEKKRIEKARADIQQEQVARFSRLGIDLDEDEDEGFPQFDNVNELLSALWADED